MQRVASRLVSTCPAPGHAVSKVSGLCAIALLIGSVPASRMLESCPVGGLESQEARYATTAADHSLLQSMSVSHRIRAGAITEEAASPEVTNNATLQLNESHSQAQLAAEKTANDEPGAASVNESSNDTSMGGDAVPGVVMPARRKIRMMLQIVKNDWQLLKTESKFQASARMLLVLIAVVGCFGIYMCVAYSDGKSRDAGDRSSDRRNCDPRGYDPRVVLQNLRETPLSPALAVKPPSPVVTSIGKVEGSFSSDSEDERGTLHFCPDLLVPAQCECILLVPFSTSGVLASSFNIMDMNGSTVLRASTQNAAGVWRLYLTSASGDALAQCREVRPSNSSGNHAGMVEYHFLRNGGHYFGKLVARAQDRYELQTLEERRLHFWGNFHARAVNITDDAGRLMATTEFHNASFENGHRFRLRVAPMTDVGLALCGLLCINKLMVS